MHAEYSYRFLYVAVASLMRLPEWLGKMEVAAR